MSRLSLDDLNAFLIVAQERSFTRAAARLGTSQSALSHKLRALEERLGLRLLNRTTRSVAPTHAGERLVAALAPRLEEIGAELAALTELRDRPAGTVRITATEYTAERLIWPKLAPLLAEHPDINLEIDVAYDLKDIVTERYDAGVRTGDILERDMIAVPIGPPLRMAVVGAPAYFETHAPPLTPQDLTAHRCINLRLPTRGGLYAWELEKDGRELNVRVDGQLVFNATPLVVAAAIAGFGLACLPESEFLAPLAEGRLVRVLEDWCPPFPGYHLYYPSRRQLSAAFSLIVQALRWRS
jgi:DNA-binding transcriptional LysR family regulator